MRFNPHLDAIPFSYLLLRMNGHSPQQLSLQSATSLGTSTQCIQSCINEQVNPISKALLSNKYAKRQHESYADKYTDDTYKGYENPCGSKAKPCLATSRVTFYNQYYVNQMAITQRANLN